MQVFILQQAQWFSLDVVGASKVALEAMRIGL